MRVDVVREREDRLDVGGVPLHRYLTGLVVVLALEEDDVLVDGVLGVVDVGDEVLDPAPRRRTRSRPSPSRSSVRTIRRPRVRKAVSRRRWTSGYEKSTSSKTTASGRKWIVVLPVSLVSAAPATSTSPSGTPRSNSCRYSLPSRRTSATSQLRERVHDRDPDAVEAARDLVAVAAELAARVQLRQHDRHRREVLVLDQVDDAAAVVGDGDGIVRMEADQRRGRCAPRAASSTALSTTSYTR